MKNIKMKEDESRIFWISKLNELWKSNDYCDITIIIDDARYECHRIVLSAACSYFRCLFSSNFPDSKLPEIVLEEIDKEAFETILKYVYNGVIELSTQNAFSILKASNYLGTPELEQKCISFIESHITVENILQICIFADCPLNDSQFARTVLKHAAARMNEVMFCDFFANISPELLESIFTRVRDEFCGYFSCVCGHSKYAEAEEYELWCKKCSIYLRRAQPDKKNIFPAIVRWVMKDVQKRITCFPKLSRFADLPEEYINAWETMAKELKCDVEPKCSDEVKAFVKTKNEGIRVVKWQPANGWICEPGFSIIAKKLHTLVINKCSYFLTSGENKETNQFLKSENNGPLMELQPPPVHTSNFKLANTIGTVYLYDSSETSVQRYAPLYFVDVPPEIGSSNVYAYIVEWNKWFSIPAAPEQLFHSYFVASKEMVYLIGGSATFSLTDSSTKDVLQIYNPKTTEWTTATTNLNFSLKGTASVYDDKIYVCEEFITTAIHRNTPITFYIFDIVFEKWQTLSVIQEIEFIPRVLFPFENHLWIFPPQPKSMIKVYNVKLKCWSEIAPIPSQFITETNEKIEIESIEGVVMCR